jgi:hypothetical protein
MKGGDDITGIFEASGYFSLILTFCGTTKKEWLLRKNYFKYSKFFANYRGMLLRKPTPQCG